MLLVFVHANAWVCILCVCVQLSACCACKVGFPMCVAAHVRVCVRMATS
jgi:hypothetical protein